jgi:transcriptional regulator with XRE-family HTH domain
MTERTKNKNILVEDLKAFLKTQKISQAEFARRISVSPASISLFLRGIYPADDNKLAEEILTEINIGGNLYERCRYYITAHLCETCKDLGDIISEIQENKIHPSRNHNPKERVKFLRELVEEQLKYIERIIIDLRRLK